MTRMDSGRSEDSSPNGNKTATVINRASWCDCHVFVSSNGATLILGTHELACPATQSICFKLAHQRPLTEDSSASTPHDLQARQLLGLIIRSLACANRPAPSLRTPTSRSIDDHRATTQAVTKSSRTHRVYAVLASYCPILNFPRTRPMLGQCQHVEWPSTAVSMSDTMSKTLKPPSEPLEASLRTLNYEFTQRAYSLRRYLLQFHMSNVPCDTAEIIIFFPDGKRPH